jgi:hypothetical protein
VPVHDTGGSRRWPSDNAAAAGHWTNPAGRPCQHCPACHDVVTALTARRHSDPVWEPDAYRAEIADHLDDAVYNHLFYGSCPVPENVL